MTPVREHDGLLINDADWRSRLAVLESEHRHTVRQIEEMSQKLNEIHDILAGTRMAKWIFLGFVSVAGFVIMNVKDVVGLFR